MTALTPNIEKIISANKITWLGLDFTHAKMIGSIGFTNPTVICNDYIHFKWNSLILKEYEKYNIGLSLNNKNIDININIVKNRNKNVIPDSLIIEDSYTIQEAKISEIINEYPKTNVESINLVFIVESFNKYNEEANIWVTFFNSSTNEVLYTKKMQGKPSGFGVRNYWANSVNWVIKQLKIEYNFWLKHRTNY